jgi:TRAP-type mannitol/chloroaromatic compound transport system permease small subunit
LQGIAEILKSVLVIRGTANGSRAESSDKETKELIL